MPIFLLTPRVLDDPHWAMTTRRTPVQIEALGEQEARNRAALRYSLALRNDPVLPLGAFAWRMSSLVSAQVVDTADPNVEFIPSEAAG